VPDNLIAHRGKLLGLELKSPQGGKCSPAQRATRAALLRAGIHTWWECRSANAAMWALAKSGVKFREIVHADGTVERWKKPRLADWEKPRRDPAEPRSLHPVVAAQRRAARQRSKARQRERAAVQLAKERNFPTSPHGDAEWGPAARGARTWRRGDGPRQ
jgi:hypothetical protein